MPAIQSAPHFFLPSPFLELPSPPCGIVQLLCCHNFKINSSLIFLYISLSLTMHLLASCCLEFMIAVILPVTYFLALWQSVKGLVQLLAHRYIAPDIPSCQQPFPGIALRLSLVVSSIHAQWAADDTFLFAFLSVACRCSASPSRTTLCLFAGLLGQT